MKVVIALSILEKEFGKDHVDAGISHNNVGGTLLSRGDYVDAMKEFQTAKRILTNSFGPHHQYTEVIENNIGQCEMKMKKAKK